LFKLECRAAWIFGTYATSLPWDEVAAFYTNYGFVRDTNDGTLRSYNGQFIRGGFTRVIGLFRDPHDWEDIHNPTVRSAIQAAIADRQTVYSFGLYYKENEDIYRHSPCWHD
jgi:hypothetical protein